MKFRDDCVGGLDMQCIGAETHVELELDKEKWNILNLLAALADDEDVSNRLARKCRKTLEKLGYYEYIEIRDKRDAFLKKHPKAREEEAKEDSEHGID